MSENSSKARPPARSRGSSSRGPVGSALRKDAVNTGLSVDAEAASTSQRDVEPPMSSAAFLHHLHTDPSSHHISLAAPTGSATPTRSRTASEAGKVKVVSEAPSKRGSPKSLQLPLEPTVAALKPKSATVPGTGPAQGADSSAGPSALARPLVVQRQLSKRGRPSTAPGPTRSPSERPLSPGEYFGSGSSQPSPDIELEPIASADSPFVPPQVSSPQTASMDAMISCGMPQESGLDEAVDMMSISSGSPPTRVLGRAGPQQEAHRRSADVGTMANPSPPPQLSWRAFGMSYAHGLFDPNRVPNPPLSDPTAYNTRMGKLASADSSPSHRPSPLMAAGSSSGSVGLLSTDSEDSGTTMTSTSSAPVSSIASSAPRTGMAAALAARKKALELESIPQSVNEQGPLRPDQLRLPSYSMAAATVRMAASGYQRSDLSPLAVPSPERELTDPLASFVPGSGSTLRGESASSDPGSRNPLSRSMSSAFMGKTDLPTIIASPAATPLEHPRHHAQHQRSSLTGTASSLAPPKPEPARVASSPGSLGSTGGGGIVANQRIPPATAPIEKAAAAQDEGDYFGTTSVPRFDRQQSSVSYTSQSSSNQTITNATSTPMVRSKSSEDHPPTPPPAAPRTQSYGHRQRPGSSSSSSQGGHPSPPAFANAADLGALYEKYGWLAAPLPPNEASRRKALYRFNILHTSADVNFDRIAHMAKLVFNTRIVLVALIDGEEQWHKSHTGLAAAEAKRISSFCGHTILVTSDEPFVVLNATQDWRFANNPQVTGPPHIRFYAGAPLRTSDGHNLGSLCIIDDKPRTEFPPRSRLILKEFAAVTMREMELWRDKLQLRIRDKIQTSMEKFTRECLEMDAKSPSSNIEAATRMDQVYARAASLICSTLDIDGCFILDLGQFESVDVETERGTQSVYRADPYSAESTVLELSGDFGPVNPFPVLASSPSPVPTRALTGEEHRKMSDFLMNHRDGRIFEKVAPSWIRYLFPADLKYGMVVPVFGVNQQPFALIAAYSNNKAKQFLEGYELQFLRAIGVIILSAVLRRRMVLADKTKSVLISSVSHELRTPLHGILAAAELLSDTNLDSNQLSFLKTVQTCGNTLIETVNHVLDFTKLSGSSGSSSEGSIKLTKVNLASLIEQTVEGVWIGQRARFFMGDADIGSFYAPPSGSGGGGLLTRGDQAASIARDLAHVETVIDIGYREKGWLVRCERGGLRRVLMNLVGNSLKFTKDGYVQITLKELPHSPGSKMIPVEMAVIDTGKGIGKDFLKDQLFHPFSQENPLQTGTGLGLAIVNSIVRSDNVNGKVDVWSSEGRGTEIRVSFEVEVFDEDDDQSMSSESSITSSASGFGRGHSVSFFGYDTSRRGSVLALDVLSSYAASWQFELQATSGDIYVLNESEDLLNQYRDTGKPLVLLQSSHTSMTTGLRDAINKSGGFCQIVHKPIGPTVLRQALHRAVVWQERGGAGETTPMSEIERPSFSRNESEQTNDSAGSNESTSTISDLAHRRQISGQHMTTDRQPLLRRRSEEPEHSHQHATPARPTMAPRGLTYHHGPPDVSTSMRNLRKSSITSDTSEMDTQSPTPGSPGSSASHLSTISLADGGVMLKAAQLPSSAPRMGRPPRVMVVEDNIINRRVLGAFLKKRGYEWAEAYDGRSGVDLFDQTDPDYWDVILMDISMPVMNGHEATRAIRKIEASRRSGRPPTDIPTPSIPAPGQPITPSTISLPPPKVLQSRVKIFALTGLATSDDKREAFGSGVDGYLVKPVSLTSLDLIFKKIGY